MRSGGPDGSLPKEVMHPELMVIGDSLAQGCRSLTVKRDFCAQSWGARLAHAQDWPFKCPDFPREILFDLEYEIRKIGNLIHTAPDSVTFEFFVTRVLKNLRSWLRYRKESDWPCFDNLGLAGAKISDVLDRSAYSSNEFIKRKFPQGAEGPLRLNPTDIGDVHIAINGRFTLNPSKDPMFDQYTPMEWVRRRLPKRLIVQIGHNHGLYHIGSNARDVPFDGGDVDGDESVTFWQSFTRLAGAIARLPKEVCHILVMLLPKVGAAANLRPRGVERVNGYARSYYPVFSLSSSTLTGSRLQQIDAKIDACNLRIKQLFERFAPGRVQFFNTFEMLNNYDYKNGLDDSERIWVTKSQAVDNFYVSGKWHPNRIETGGFLSVDGMHPTGCGYAFVAEKVIHQLGWKPIKNALSDAFNQEELLKHFPWKLDALVLILEHIRLADRRGAIGVRALPSLTGGLKHLSIVDAIRLMQAAVFRS